MTEKKESAAKTLPSINLPPRPAMDALFTGGFSPGPMTLVSSFFSDHPDTEYKSFSQLLAGAMASPGARPTCFLETTCGDNTPYKEVGMRDGFDSGSGFKQSRPMNLVVSARSPLFTVPPGLSPSGFLNSPGFFSPQSPFGMSHQQALAQVTAQAALAQSHMQMQEEYQSSSAPVLIDTLPHNPSLTSHEALQQQIPVSTSDAQNSPMESSELSQYECINHQPSYLPVDKPADDGYNWRKYGQKPIKGCEYPRSYYKCTHLKCLVKKKVERSSEGQITQIVYKGQHSHEKPQSSRRGKDSTNLIGSNNSQAKVEVGGSQGPVNLHASSVVPCKSQESGQVQLLESSDSEQGCNLETKEDDDEPNPKRRNVVEETTVASSHKTVTEPKIIVQTRSEVDLLDDGYRWRKYGQKVVKGNPYPRSYYKCTSLGCKVRKHVERASTDPKAVVTTYEGKHNHDVPVGRNSSSHNSVPRTKPNNVVAEKQHHRGPLVKNMDFENDNQRPILLRLKEEKITA